MNVEEMLVETLNDDDWGPCRWNDPVARITKRYERRKRQRLAVTGVAVAVVLISGVAVGLNYLPGRSDAVVEPAEPGPDQSDAPVSRTVVVDGMTWTISASASSAGPCVGVTVANDSIGGGCGHSDNPLLRWGVGGIRERGSYYEVAYGVAPANAAEVRVSLGSGKELVDDHLTSDGLWLFVRAGDPSRHADEFTAITVLDAEGQEVTRQTVPSLSAARARAQQPSSDHVRGMG